MRGFFSLSEVASPLTPEVSSKSFQKRSAVLPLRNKPSQHLSVKLTTNTETIALHKS
jgi:hypothetical protein